MLLRYQDQEVAKIWNKNNQMQVWLKIELLVAQYWHQERLFSDQIMDQISKLVCQYQRFQELELVNKHEIAAFVTMLSEQLPSSAGKWIHYGLTSNDVLDTTQNWLIQKTCPLITEQLEIILKVLKKLAFQEKSTLMLGRTHGMPAEPITLGFKFALWFYELENHHHRFQINKQETAYAKILGPTGMSLHSDLALNAFVAQKLNLQPIKIANQIITRDHFIAFFNTLTNLVTSIEKMTIEIRNLHRREINEINEGFAPKQEGSSAMPHKKNPIFSENICGLARYLRNMAQSFYQTNLLWHERDLTNSSIERIAIPDYFHLLLTILKRFRFILQNLRINHKQIKRNWEKQQVAVFSHRILLALVKWSKLDRKKAYQLVQKASFHAMEEGGNFRQSLIAGNILDYLTPEQLDNCFNHQTFLVNVDHFFRKIFS